MKYVKIGLVVLGCGVLTIALSACAPRQHERMQKRDMMKSQNDGPVGGAALAVLFTSMDRDFDLRVTYDEASEAMAAHWDRIDEDGDGRASIVDISLWSERVLGSPYALPNYTMFDRDQNKEISRVEFMDRLNMEFKKMDQNKDGALSRKELLAASKRSSGPDDEMQNRGSSRQGNGGPGRRPH